MLAALMPGPRRSRLLAVAAVVVAAGAAACGTQDIDLASSDPDYEGAQLFVENCSGCHTLSAAGTQGSAEQANGREYKDGPNFDQRAEEKDQVLYAIANGGFSSGPMPQDILVGEDAEKVADFVAKYSGSQSGTRSGNSPPSGASGGSAEGG
jgi:mono/diheme cytochrome c family protein